MTIAMCILAGVVVGGVLAPVWFAAAVAGALW